MRRTSESPLAGIITAIAGSILFAASSVSGAEIGRVDWTPGGGYVGDLWKFRCPAGGSVTASVDTIGDIALPDETFVSGLDPALGVFDSRGNLIAQGDDEQDCSVPTLCGVTRCPAVEVECGRGASHSILVQDAGGLAECTGGGSYLLVIEVFDEDGASLRRSAVKLGGGPNRKVPPWLLETGLTGRQGPVVDDGSAIIVPPGADTAARLELLQRPITK